MALGDRAAVHVHAELRKCVAHLMAPGDIGGIDAPEPVGTAFFLAVRFIRDPGRHAVYAVTAGHVVRDSKRRLDIRVNLNGGGFVDLPTDPQKDWVFHPTTDVVCVQHSTEWDYFSLDAEEILIHRQDIVPVGLGFPVVFYSLFTQHPGTQRNAPVARFGHVSREPGEPIEIDLGGGQEGAVEAHLIEALSWGGNSGAPAFLYRSEDVSRSRKPRDRGPWIIGLVHGHVNDWQPVKDPGRPAIDLKSP